MINRGYIIDFYNSKEGRKGQIAPILLVSMVAFLILAMIVVIVGEGAMAKTVVANATDAAALAGAATASSIINVVSNWLASHSVEWAGAMGSMGATAASIQLFGTWGLAGGGSSAGSGLSLMSGVDLFQGTSFAAEYAGAEAATAAGAGGGAAAGVSTGTELSVMSGVTTPMQGTSFAAEYAGAEAGATTTGTVVGGTEGGNAAAFTLPGWAVFVIIVILIIVMTLIKVLSSRKQIKKALKKMNKEIIKASLATAFSNARISVHKPKWSTETFEQYRQRDTEFDIYMREPVEGMDNMDREWFGKHAKTIYFNNGENDMFSQGWGIFEWKDSHGNSNFVTVLSSVRGYEMGPTSVPRPGNPGYSPEAKVRVAIIRNEPDRDLGLLSIKFPKNSAYEDPFINDLILFKSYRNGGCNYGGWDDSRMEDAQFCLIEDYGRDHAGEARHYFNGYWSLAEAKAGGGSWRSGNSDPNSNPYLKCPGTNAF